MKIIIKTVKEEIFEVKNKQTLADALSAVKNEKPTSKRTWQTVRAK